jgi:subtilisin family serine protease
LDFVHAEVVKIPNGKNVSFYIKELKKDPSIQSVQPNYKYYTSDINYAPNYYSNLWGINNTGQEINKIPGVKDIDIDGPEARAKLSGLKEVVVGVIDTGVDINHPDLKNAIWANPKEIPNDGIDNDKNGYIDDVHGWDFYHNDNTVYDLFDGDEHGTHVSGTIAAVLEGTTTNENKGVVGVAPNVKILPIKLLGPDGGTSEQAIEAIEYAQKIGIKITNNS